MLSHDGISPVGRPEGDQREVVQFREEGGRLVWDPQWTPAPPGRSQEARRHTRRRTLASGAIVIFLVAMGLTMARFGGGDRATPVLARTAQAVSNMDANGTLTQETLAARQSATQKESGCGWVQIFMPDTPAPSTQGSNTGMGIGGAAPPDPVKEIADYVAKTFKPDAEAALLSQDGSKVIIVVGWSC